MSTLCSKKLKILKALRRASGYAFPLASNILYICVLECQVGNPGILFMPPCDYS
jgi:hypothetical protein